ncbi:protein 3-oxoalanine-generating enzyme family protein [Labrys miyagiensis]|uniref:Protein 3-oxoalanine-generating enzyme family protein n=1 Tax=Labrys miyagiensis TaxID=346912 RepID=A0ABQ6CR61_9HYPH|nr:formylglycine-generating enzyme family protein [Labrys miyagiensis]GLS22856.1 protein 3-oxoalanine-generating enzyme family protein [Labrys miyagiensis]
MTAGRIDLSYDAGGSIPGDRFRDFPEAPEMIVVPAGAFLMGSPAGQGNSNEHPQHQVTIAHAFAVGIAPVTRGEFAAFIRATNHHVELGATVLDGMTWKPDPTKSWRDPGFTQADDHPVVCVSWHDAQAYLVWLGERSGGKAYRLLSEAEWEYCCRAGTTTAYSTGDNISLGQANFSRHITGTASAFRFPPNQLGLWGMHGNVWEWCEDNWHEDYVGDPPSDGSVWFGGNSALRVLRGGSWIGYPQYLRSAYRDGDPPIFRDKDVGFRVARML